MTTSAEVRLSNLRPVFEFRGLCFFISKMSTIPSELPPPPYFQAFSYARVFQGVKLRPKPRRRERKKRDRHVDLTHWCVDRAVTLPKDPWG